MYQRYGIEDGLGLSYKSRSMNEKERKIFINGQEVMKRRILAVLGEYALANAEAIAMVKEVSVDE